jgi:hypothetical protein
MMDGTVNTYMFQATDALRAFIDKIRERTSISITGEVSLLTAFSFL